MRGNDVLLYENPWQGARNPRRNPSRNPNIKGAFNKTTKMMFGGVSVWEAVAAVAGFAVCAMVPGYIIKDTSKTWQKFAKVGIGLALKGESAWPRDVKEYLPANFPLARDLSYAELGLEALADVQGLTCQPVASICRARNGDFGAMEIEIESDAPTNIVVRRFFFPAWRLTPIRPIVPTDPLRLVSFVADTGYHRYRLERVALPAETIGWGVSGLSLLLLASWVATSQLHQHARLCSSSARSARLSLCPKCRRSN